MEDLDRITQNPAVMGGKACIRGLRVTVGMVVGQLAAGQSIDALRTDYPYLEPADENPDRYESFAAVAEVSDGSGPEAVHWSELGAGDASDLDIMAYAAAHDYVALTHDLDLAAILAATHGKKPSVVQIRAEHLAPDLIGSHIVSALRQLAAELDYGALVTVEPKRTRMRVLPLRKQSS